MKTFTTFLLLIITNCYLLTGQENIKLFLNSNFEKTDSINAKYIRLATVKDGHYFITDQNILGENLNYVEFSSINPWIEDGLAIHYNQPNEIYSTGHYRDGKIVGNWIYYKSGKAVDTVNYDFDISKILPSDSTTNYKKLKKAKEKSKEYISVTDSLSKFLEKNFHLPARSRSISTKVNVQIEFVLDSDGKIKIPSIRYAIHEDLKCELYRVLSLITFNKPITEPKSYNMFFDYIEGDDKQIDNSIIISPKSVEKSKEAETEFCKEINGDIFVIVEEMPMFQGKDLNKFRDYVNKSLNYPEEAKKLGKKGRVTVAFVIDTEGVVKCARVLRGIHPSLDNEALRVVKSSPKWKPGYQRGKPVNVRFNMPIIFDFE